MAAPLGYAPKRMTDDIDSSTPNPPTSALPLSPTGKRIPPPPRGPVKKASDEEIIPAKARRRRPRKGNGAADGRTRGPGDRSRRPRADSESRAPSNGDETVAADSAEEVSAEPAGPHVPTEEEKAKRKERVAAVKDALSRSVGEKGTHVAPARAALKEFLRNLNDPHQPNDERFQILLEAPFRPPPKKRTPGFGGGGRR